MGTVFKPIVTRPLPAGAKVIERDGKRVARWTSPRDGVRTADVRTTPRGDCVAIESSKFLARYRDGQNVVRTVPTGCRDLMAARAVLADLERRAELVRSGMVSPAQDAMADHRRMTITAHVAAYLESLRLKGNTSKHVATVQRHLREVIAACGFKTLADIRREPVERWLAGPDNAGRSARTKNQLRNAMVWLCNFCVDRERMLANPLARLPRFNEAIDRRRQPRALTPEELERLLDAARRRPLAEALKFNRGWRRGQNGAHLRPETRAKLERLGYERALTYRVLVLTGLRLGELAAIQVGDVVLDDPRPHIVLDAKHEKARRGATIPLRSDLASDLQLWIGSRRDGPLFRISPNAIKVFDRDLRFAGIEKRDARGRVACLHSLRHTHGTLLTKAGVPPRVVQAALRHASPEFSMKMYVDPKLLDVARALDALPDLSICDSLPVAARQESLIEASLVPTASQVLHQARP
jgi:integrase